MFDDSLLNLVVIEELNQGLLDPELGHFVAFAAPYDGELVDILFLSVGDEGLEVVGRLVFLDVVRYSD